MKKVFCGWIVIVLMLSLFGCSNSDKQDEKGSEIVTQTESSIETAIEELTERSEPTEKPTEAPKPTYTAVELVEMSLNEIIDIMGGDYKEDDTVISYAFSSDPIPYLYNYEVLPGFSFVTRDSDFCGIVMTDGAKLNNKISSDMTYNQIADNIGEMDAGIAGQGEGAFVGCYVKVDNYSVTFCFPLTDYIKDNINGMEISDLLKLSNPTLQSITLRKETVSKSDAINISEPEDDHTDPPIEIQDSDYSSYLGTFGYIFDNDGQLDYDHAMVTSVTFNSINGTTADLTIFKGNISKVTQVDVTGEIIDDKIDFSYDQDGWFNTGHGTITLNGDSIHLYAVVDSYGPGARMGLECDDDLTRG